MQLFGAICKAAVRQSLGANVQSRKVKSLDRVLTAAVILSALRSALLCLDTVLFPVCQQPSSLYGIRFYCIWRCTHQCCCPASLNTALLVSCGGHILHLRAAAVAFAGAASLVTIYVAALAAMTAPSSGCSCCMLALQPLVQHAECGWADWQR